MGQAPGMLVIRVPGVYPPQGDTELLVACLRRERLDGASRVLDLGTGTGAVALAAARTGARVTAVDLSARAVLTAWLNTRLHRRRVELRHGDLAGPVAGRRFDLVASNPRTCPPRARPEPLGGARRWPGTRGGTGGSSSTGSAGRRRGC